jgi:hypothetical protein
VKKKIFLIFLDEVNPDVGDLDSIFQALETNSSVKKLKISYRCKILLNLKDEESLRFIEKNLFIKTLNLSGIMFIESEMKILEECLLKNQSINDLNLSGSNYAGSFDFLQNGNVKVFSFCDIWGRSSVNFNNLFDNLKSKCSLNVLDVSGNYDENPQIEEFIEIMSDVNTRVKHLKMNSLEASIDLNFHKLLKNPNIKKLELMDSFPYTSLPLSTFFSELISNKTLLSLDICENDPKFNWDKIKETHNSIEFLNLSSLIFPIQFQFRLWMEFLKRFQFFPKLDEFSKLERVKYFQKHIGEKRIQISL